ncbi:MAG: DUF302 domain-containing protein [Laribacter sp.]|nr:DUF302 domain-containing protein [Laribacter sp.]MBP9608091.1 DUF302 domain-containing protein [Laribacter sp.]
MTHSSSPAAGLVSVASPLGVSQTLDRLVAALAQHGWREFARIDHAGAAAAAGLSLLPRTVLVFGNPASGTGPMQHAPTLAIDLPMKMLVWQDDAGQVWVSYNSADYFADVILARHGLTPPDGLRERLTDLLEQAVQDATAFYAK